MSQNSSTPSAASATSSKSVPDAADAAPARRWSLALRLTTWYAGSSFVLVAIAVGLLYWGLVDALETEDDHFLIGKARVLLAMLRDKPGDLHELKEEIERESSARPGGQLYMRVLGPDGRTRAETAGMGEQLPADRFPGAVAAQAGRERTSNLEFSPGQRFRVVSLRAAADAGPVVQVAMDRSEEEQLLARYRWYAGLTLTLAVLGCAATGYVIARRGLRPLRDIIAAAARIRPSTLHKRLDDTALPAELSALTGTFNHMLDRLEGSFQRLERFSADIAHELRTPVNNLRGEVEVALGQSRSPEAYREVLASCLEEFGRLASLIDSLLFLARAESPQGQLVKQRLDVGRELAIVREYYSAAADEAGIELAIATEAQLPADLDRTLFQRAVGNLIANALAHTPRGGRVAVSVARINDSIRIEVADTGRGIAAADLPHVFDRFYRADPARVSGPGSVGLGLALVKSIVELHQGSCTIVSEPGQGTRVCIELPVGSS